MGELIVLTGPAGAGKSTVAARLVEHFDRCALVPGDSFFALLRRGATEPWLPHSQEQNTAVIEAAAAATGRLARYCDVVYDGVLGPWLLPAFLHRTGLEHLHYAVVMPPLQTCVDRVRTRTGHGFTDSDATEQMWHELQRTTIDPDQRFSDPDADPAQLARSIVERAAAVNPLPKRWPVIGCGS